MKMHNDIRPKNIPVSANPTDPVFVLCRPCNFYGLPEKKNKKIFIPTDPNIFQKIGQTTLKMSELQNYA